MELHTLSDYVLLTSRCSNMRLTFVPSLARRASSLALLGWLITAQRVGSEQQQAVSPPHSGHSEIGGKYMGMSIRRINRGWRLVAPLLPEETLLLEYSDILSLFLSLYVSLSPSPFHSHSS